MCRSRLIHSALVAVVLLGFLFTTRSSGEGETETCVGEFRGQEPTKEQLRAVLISHSDWWNLRFEKAHVRNTAKRANLCGANLNGADLDGAALPHADLSHATLIGANLSGALLEYANLSHADLSSAKLTAARMGSANLIHADLSSANLMQTSLGAAELKGELGDPRRFHLGANLSHAKLIHANARETDLSYANLSHADLHDTNLSYANLRGADLDRASLSGADLSSANLSEADLIYTRFFGISKSHLPAFDQWQSVKNLSLIKFLGDAASTSAFRQLREDFRKNGMRTEERGITAALERAQTDAKETNPLERGFRFVAFDLTAEYGNSPGRPLIILVLGMLLFALPYARALMTKMPGRPGAIWMVWHEDRLTNIFSDDSDKKKRERLSGLSLPKALLYGLYFSLLSAFHFGWRDLNVGNWISRIQPREYVLRASGWVRVVSGLQSLLSVYLVALWALTYFGRPFE
jgi:uncharacterized protein YjbI with pentapeptide repeats